MRLWPRELKGPFTSGGASPLVFAAMIVLANVISPWPDELSTPPAPYDEAAVFAEMVQSSISAVAP